MNNTGRQQGQVMAMGIVLMALIVVAMLGLSQIGKLGQARNQQRHSIDAAAYSGALMQARALNMQAYLNTTQLAHQVAMAHLITMGSWVQWAKHSQRSAMRQNPPSWVIGTHFGVEHATAYQQSMSFIQGDLRLQQLRDRFTEHDRLSNQLLARMSQRIKNTWEQNRFLTIQRVLAANYDGAMPLRWRIESTHKYDLQSIIKPARAYRTLMSDIQKAYGFLSKRDHTARSPFPISEMCPHLRHELRRRGETYLNARGQWQSVDTQSYHALRANRWIGCYYREYTMGWGWVTATKKPMPGIQYDENIPDSFSHQDFWRWVKTATSWGLITRNNPFGNSRAYLGRLHWSGGLNFYVDIVGNRTPTLGFVLHATHTQQNIQLRSAAETFFARPTPRRDGKREKPNLWHPYWQARLVPNF